MLNKFAPEFKYMIAMQVGAHELAGRVCKALGEGKPRLFDYDHPARHSAINGRFCLECRI